MKRKRAFTIVELVIIIAIISILASVLLPTFSSVIKKAKYSYFLQNERNKWMNEFVESSLDEDYKTTKGETVSVSEDDAKINAIKSELHSLFGYLSSKIKSCQDGTYGIDMSDMKTDFFTENPEYSYVGSFGAGVVRDIYSYADKYIILYWYPYGTSNFKIFLYDDVVIRDNPNMEGWSEITKADVYYKLKVVRVGEETTTTTDDEQVPKYTIEVVKITEPQG